MTEPFSFNLWVEPWITLERPDGEMEALGIAQTLLRAHEFRAIYESSPLVIVGVHRLLTAILQAIYDPQRPADLKQLWAAGHFEEDKIAPFGAEFGHRFDLFSADVPFMQSADLPMKPDKSPKTIGYLADELPTGTAVTHFRHGSDDAKVFCQACAAKGLLCVPAFASSGGSGIKPSINGVPPIYVLPIGRNLFESLSQALLLPAFQPVIANKGIADIPVWKRAPVVERGVELNEVGYLQSLTFSARRVRLQPEQKACACSRCGATTKTVIKSIIYEMGESRPKDAAFWQDPFAAYREQESKQPIPVRPNEGKALWREFNSLFLKGDASTSKKKVKLLRPRVLDQLGIEPWSDLLNDVQTFRCVGMRTDMKAKIFEWVDTSFDVPTALLIDQSGGVRVGQALECADEGASAIFTVFKSAFNASTKNGERFESLRRRMREDYWASLAAPFRQFVLRLGAAQDRDTELYRWVDEVRLHALSAFKAAAEQVGDDAISLRQRVQGEVDCRQALARLRGRYVPETEEEKAAKVAKAAEAAKKKKTTRSKKA